MKVEGGGYSDTYPRIAIDCGLEGNFRNPYFTNYNELNLILGESFLLFEELKEGRK